MDLLTHAIIGFDGYLRMIPAGNVVKMPAFHFNDDDAEVRCNDNEIRVPVVDVGLVIDEIVIGKFFSEERMCVPHPGLPLQIDDRGCIRPFMIRLTFLSPDDSCLDN
jgi:hypothetical protein